MQHEIKPEQESKQGQTTQQSQGVQQNVNKKSGSGKTSSRINPQDGTAIVKAQHGLWLRKGPGTKYNHIKLVKYMERVKIVGRTKKGWVPVETSDGEEGYMLKSWLSFKATSGKKKTVSNNKKTSESDAKKKTPSSKTTKNTHKDVGACIDKVVAYAGLNMSPDLSGVTVKSPEIESKPLAVNLSPAVMDKSKKWAHPIKWDAQASRFKHLTPNVKAGKGETLQDLAKKKQRELLAKEIGCPNVTAEAVIKVEKWAQQNNYPKAAQKLSQLLAKTAEKAAIEVLNVEKSSRYRIKGGTLCNIYGYDMVTAMGGYLPRVWWMNDSLAKRAEKGEHIKAVYGKTVKEVNANYLYDWFTKWGSKFGWVRKEDVNEAQKLANQGKLVVIVWKKPNNRHGHIAIIAPEDKKHHAKRDKNKNVTVPLESQAGSYNVRYRALHGVHWKGHLKGHIYVMEGKRNPGLLDPLHMGE